MSHRIKNPPVGPNRHQSLHSNRPIRNKPPRRGQVTNLHDSTLTHNLNRRAKHITIGRINHKPFISERSLIDPQHLTQPHPGNRLSLTRPPGFPNQLPSGLIDQHPMPQQSPMLPGLRRTLLILRRQRHERINLRRIDTANHRPLSINPAPHIRAQIRARPRKRRDQQHRHPHRQRAAHRRGRARFLVRSLLIAGLRLDRPWNRLAQQFHTPATRKPRIGLVERQRQAQIVAALAAGRTFEVDVIHPGFP
nr:hypothetical protein HUO10_005943 [Paraburkholderia busanensis]